jgi:hypothetical protein
MTEFPCATCGSKKRFHKKGCDFQEKIFIHPNQESPEMLKADMATAFIHEVTRTPQDLPQVGEWYVLNLLTPIGYDSVKDCRTYDIEITLAPVSTITPHGRDFRVTFDMEQTKVFKANLAGHLLTRADKVVKALRQMADLVERGAE